MNRLKTLSIYVLCATGAVCVGLRRSVAQSDATKQQKIRSDYLEALEALSADRPAIAIRKLESVLGLDPANVQAQANLGVIYFVQGNCRAAAQAFRKALSRQPDQWKVQAMLGICERSFGHLAVAQHLFESSFPHLQDTKLRTQVGLELVQIYSQNGDLANAPEVINVLRQIDPTNLAILYAAYRTYRSLEESALDRMALVAPDSGVLHLALAENLINEGSLKGAICQYRAAIARDPRLSAAHYELGEALLQYSSSKPARAEAENQFRASLALEPDNVKSMCKLGDLYMEEADSDRAYEYYFHALKLAPGDSDAEIGLARVFTARGEPERAVEYLRAATRHDPLNPSAYYQLALLDRRLGRNEESAHEMASFERLEKAHGVIRKAFQRASAICQ